MRGKKAEMAGISIQICSTRCVWHFQVEAAGCIPPLTSRSPGTQLSRSELCLPLRILYGELSLEVQVHFIILAVILLAEVESHRVVERTEAFTLLSSWLLLLSCLPSRCIHVLHCLAFSLFSALRQLSGSTSNTSVTI